MGLTFLERNGVVVTCPKEWKKFTKEESALLNARGPEGPTSSPGRVLRDRVEK